MADIVRDDDVAAIAPVPAVGPALGRTEFPSKSDASVAAVASAHSNDGLVNKHQGG